jgi:hypothetical protein
VLGTRVLHSDVDRALEQRLGFGVKAGIEVQHAKAIELKGEGGVLRP